MKRLYCANCQRFTDHVDLPSVYATRCMACNAQTGTIQRLQALQVSERAKLTAPDGRPAEIVENTPTSVTFHVVSGEHKGYYHHDKRTGKNTISQE